MSQPDVVIVGAGVIGLSCALELEARGARVTLLERGPAAREASWAAAGMLAAHDAQHPPELRRFAEFSIAHYPAFLDRIAAHSDINVAMETEWTLEQPHGHDGAAQHDLPQLQQPGFVRIAEQSLDPRKLTSALRAAVRASTVELRENAPVLRWSETSDGVDVHTASTTFHAAQLLDCTGAWSALAVRPAKGQMLRVLAPGALTAAALGNMVVRTPHIYLVPRLDGTVVIGATVEDAGFDTATHDTDLDTLRGAAAALIPAMAAAPEVERWAGLRPDTADHLPLIGRTGERTFIAAGHFRNGILLAPGTAAVMGRLLSGEQPGLGLDAFAPGRFQPAAAARPIFARA